MVLSTGIGSPVMVDSSMAEWPSVILPSTGIFVPGLTIMVSPIFTSLMGISISLLSRQIVAVFDCSPRSFWIASPVRAFDFVSRYFPRMTKPITTIVTSK